MSKVYENLDPETIFGDLNRRLVWSNNSMLMPDDTITILNSNCDLHFDCLNGEFLKEPPFFAFVVELDLLEIDLSGYVPAKSNNGGGYAFAKCKVKKIIEEGY